MAARKKSAKTSQKSEPGPNFEEAIEELESLVEAMENEQLPLEELVANYEKGSKLIAHCQSVLESARERIELITLGNEDDSGLENQPLTHDVGADPDNQEAPPSSADATTSPANQDDDIRLL